MKPHFGILILIEEMENKWLFDFHPKVQWGKIRPLFISSRRKGRSKSEKGLDFLFVLWLITINKYSCVFHFWKPESLLLSGFPFFLNSNKTCFLLKSVTSANSHTENIHLKKSQHKVWSNRRDFCGSYSARFSENDTAFIYISAALMILNIYYWHIFLY